ncbi:PP2C family serine/threonine-protein phosphatase [Listeria ivanovii]|uniref:PP2C family serine/threonine-protein phosphatase n=1 Tax=Listeria ivanovii TaxID=1638 RepID=UPI00190937B3|nr:PP2C family serine/threonine-protein phosphatase [Listeria ivanovii]MBK3913311.1 SpoIIE family protein phosphatase [Listeria ivanovii subsp. ivanovii]MBK3920572.1 SpoIIE family protein phosphatase [Listeria ivanovii subsp. ivanovii]MBK3925602.1 SpoIIE family protein phosphatase [Listeria ivanovii subsp. ivanovii]
MNKAVESNDLFVFQRSKALQQYCGDVYFTHEDENGFLYVLSDGLGSGLEANRAAKATIEAIKEDLHADLTHMLEKANQAVSGLRGAAIAIIKADYLTKTIYYTGMGNIRFYMIGSENKLIFPLSGSGFLSGRKQKYRLQNFKYKPGSKFLLHSDGLVLSRVRKNLESPLCVGKLGHLIEQSILDIPTDDVTFLLGQFPN